MNKKENTYELIGNNTIKAICPNGRYFYFDQDDLDVIQQRYWSVSQTGYVVGCFNGKPKALARHLLNAPSETIVDHINHKPYDNRRSNLRICTASENARNVSAFRRDGSRRGIKKRAYGFFVWFKNGDTYVSKRCSSYEEAVSQRNKWEEEHFGEFAPWDRYDEEKNKISKAYFCENVFGKHFDRERVITLRKFRRL